MNNNNDKLRLPFVLAGTVLFHYLFWKEELGINVMIHFVFSVICYALFYRASFRNNSFRAALLGTFVIASAVVYHQSAMAQVLYWFSTFLTIGFAHGLVLRTVLYATMRTGRDLFYVPMELIMLLRPKRDIGPLMSRVLWFIKIAILPGIVALIFLALYSNSNEVFGNYVDGFFNKIGEMIEAFIEKFGLVQFIFFVLGGVLTLWMVQSTISSRLKEREDSRKLKLDRAEIENLLPTDPEGRQHKLGKFMNENASGTLLMVLINLMLLGLNLIDVTHYWFAFDSSGINLTQFVHEGTYILILSILLSMAIMLYYFRNYQNFSPKQPRLALLAYIWIFQNALLVFSVCIRNYHYIENSALAYKRIGVFFFLLLVLFGLYTLFLKISGKLTGFYLLKLNSWSTYLVFVVLACINWDGLITRYNLSKIPDVSIDEEFLLNMSDKTLPLLYENKSIFEEYNVARLGQRIHNFEREKEQRTWLSWNYSEAVALSYFKQNPVPYENMYEQRSKDPDLYLNE